MTRLIVIVIDCRTRLFMFIESGHGGDAHACHHGTYTLSSVFLGPLKALQHPNLHLLAEIAEKVVTYAYTRRRRCMFFVRTQHVCTQGLRPTVLLVCLFVRALLAYMACTHPPRELTKPPRKLHIYPPNRRTLTCASSSCSGHRCQCLHRQFSNDTSWNQQRSAWRLPCATSRCV